MLSPAMHCLLGPTLSTCPGIGELRAVLWVLVTTLGEVILKLFPEMLVLPAAVDEEYIRQVLVLSCLMHGSLVGGSQRIVAHGVL